MQVFQHQQQFEVSEMHYFNVARLWHGESCYWLIINVIQQMHGYF